MYVRKHTYTNFTENILKLQPVRLNQYKTIQYNTIQIKSIRKNTKTENHDQQEEVENKNRNLHDTTMTRARKTRK